MQKTVLKIQGLHCASCKAVIEDIATEFPEIKSANVDVAGGTATVEHDESFDITKFVKEINNMGQYKVLS